MTLQEIKKASWKRKLSFAEQERLTPQQRREYDRERLAADVEDFLKRGGRIKQLPHYVHRESGTEPDVSEWR